MNRAAAPALLMLLTLGACYTHPTHPVSARPPPLPSPGLVATELGEPARPVGLRARSQFYRDLADVEGPLRYVQRHGVWRGDHPGLVMLPRLERAVFQRFRGRTPLGPLRNVAAFGIHARAPLPPPAMADLFLDGEAERLALAATTFREVARPIDLPDERRAAYRVEFLRRGVAPFTFDFRFTTSVERWDLTDGSVLLRYDPLPTGDAEGVTLYRGACWIRPEGDGSLVTEFLILGTSLGVPFFLAKAARGASLRVFQDRVRALWTRAHWREAGTDPLQPKRRPRAH